MPLVEPAAIMPTSRNANHHVHGKNDGVKRNTGKGGQTEKKNASIFVLGGRNSTSSYSKGGRNHAFALRTGAVFRARSAQTKGFIDFFFVVWSSVCVFFFFSILFSALCRAMSGAGKEKSVSRVGRRHDTGRLSDRGGHLNPAIAGMTFSFFFRCIHFPVTYLRGR